MTWVAALPARFHLLTLLAALALGVAASAVVGTSSARAGIPVCNVSAAATVEVGELVTVTGTGFTPNTPITVTMTPPFGPGGALGGPTDGSGTFVAQFTPDVAGNWVVDFSQVSGCSDSVTISVTFICAPDFSVAPSASVPLGVLVTVTGTGFGPGNPISVTISAPSGPGGAVGGLADIAGSFSAMFTPNIEGNWVLDFSQANGCSDSVTIVAGDVGTPTPGPTDLPDAATTEPAAPGAPFVLTFVLGLSVLLIVATARTRRPA